MRIFFSLIGTFCYFSFRKVDDSLLIAVSQMHCWCAYFTHSLLDSWMDPGVFSFMVAAVDNLMMQSILMTIWHCISAFSTMQHHGNIVLLESKISVSAQKRCKMTALEIVHSWSHLAVAQFYDASVSVMDGLEICLTSAWNLDTVHGIIQLCVIVLAIY